MACPITNLEHLLNTEGLFDLEKVTDTLQGSIWRANLLRRDSSMPAVVKITDIKLHSKSVSIVNGQQINVFENIVSEINILKLLTSSKQTKCPASIVKYIDSFKTKDKIILCMTYGGKSLFDFIVKAHQLISNGQIEIKEWHKILKIIFKQMIAFVEYIHSMNVCHFDISLENFLINDIEVEVTHLKGNGETSDDKLRFCSDSVQVQACDFGLAELFSTGSQFHSSKYCGKTQYYSPEIANKKKRFNGQMNDIWCLGCVLFAMVVGGMPWERASEDCETFRDIMSGGLVKVLREWDRIHYIDQDLLDLFESIFQYEDDRSDLQSIKKSAWLSATDFV